MLNSDPPPRALIAQTDRDHRLYQLQAEWRLFPASRFAIESDIAKHPEWGIAVSNDELVRAIPGQAIAQPPSTTRRELSNYAIAKRQSNPIAKPPFGSAQGPSPEPSPLTARAQ